MINRIYFVSYKTGSTGGSYEEGSLIIQNKSWFSNPMDAHKKASEYLIKKDLDGGFCITSLYRIY